MTRKRKKTAAISPKVMRAQQFMDFKQRLMQIAIACDAVDEFKLIPKKDMDMFFSKRFRPFDIIAHEDFYMDSKFYKSVKRFVTRQLKLKSIVLENGGEILLYDYLYVGSFFAKILNEYKNDLPEYPAFDGVDRVITAFHDLSVIGKHEKGPYMELYSLAFSLSTMVNNVKYSFHIFEPYLLNKEGLVDEVRLCYRVNLVMPQRKMLVVNGKWRPAYRVGKVDVNASFSWAKVTPEQLNVESHHDEIEVYVQSHALRRLQERLDTFGEIPLQYLMYDSICKWDVVKNSQGTSLLSYDLDGTRLGYLVYDYVGGVVLIKTFLLLPNNGTPEGEKLNRIMHLQIKDKHYLHLDKLSHFIRSDIPANKLLFDKFKAAGCHHLFELDEHAMIKNVHEHEHAALMQEYIRPLIQAQKSRKKRRKPKPNKA